MKIISFNGKTYNSLEEMPVNERQAYEQIANMLVDKNGNGIPDFLEGDMVKNVITAFTSSVSFNGQTYNGINELPPDVRAKVQGAFEKLSEFGIVEKNSPMMVQEKSAKIGQEPRAISRPFVSHENGPIIQEDPPSSAMLTIISVIFVLCLVAAIAGIFFLLK